MIPATCQSLAILCIYMPTNLIDQDTFHYIQMLKQRCDHIVILAAIEDGVTMILSDPSITIHLFSNKGKDYGLLLRYLYTFDLTQYPNLTKLLITNDSCIFLHNSWRMIDMYRHKLTDVWGITSSTEHVYHIQSYFIMHETREAVEHSIRFFKDGDIENISNDHYEIVGIYELQYTKYMQDLGHSCNAIYSQMIISPISTILQDPITSNISFTNWPRLLIMGCPFLKRKRQHYTDEETFICDALQRYRLLRN
jgi:hypothetical protein